MFKPKLFSTLYLFIKKKQKKACKMKKNYPINKIIPGAHIQMVNNQFNIFRNIHASVLQDMRGQN